MSKTVILTETQLVGALKKIVNESPEDAPFGWYGDGNSEEDERDKRRKWLSGENRYSEEDEELYKWRDKLHQRLWKAIEDTDDERETQGAVKLSNKDVIEILEGMIDGLEF